MKIYCYDYSGKFMNEAKADADPMEAGKFIFPAFSTDIKPPKVKDGEFPRFVNGGWVIEKEKVKTDDHAKLPEPTYADKRANEYPPLFDYIDALVKKDNAAVEEYFEKCRAVKKKYPKPDGSAE